MRAKLLTAIVIAAGVAGCASFDSAGTAVQFIRQNPEVAAAEAAIVVVDCADPILLKPAVMALADAYEQAGLSRPYIRAEGYAIARCGVEAVETLAP